MPESKDAGPIGGGFPLRDDYNTGPVGCGGIEIPGSKEPGAVGGGFPIPEERGPTVFTSDIVDDGISGDTQKERKDNCPKGESDVWKDLEPYKNGIRTNGLKGKKIRYYEWDHLHNEIELYDSKGKPVDALDPRTGERLNKNVKHHRKLNL